MQKPGYPRSPRLGRADALSGDSELRGAQQHLREQLQADPGIEAISLLPAFRLARVSAMASCAFKAAPPRDRVGSSTAGCDGSPSTTSTSWSRACAKAAMPARPIPMARRPRRWSTLRLRTSTSAATAPLGVRPDSDRRGRCDPPPQHHRRGRRHAPVRHRPYADADRLALAGGRPSAQSVHPAAPSRRRSRCLCHAARRCPSAGSQPRPVGSALDRAARRRRPFDHAPADQTHRAVPR